MQDTLIILFQIQEFKLVNAMVNISVLRNSDFQIN